jgi:hypothetical protein
MPKVPPTIALKADTIIKVTAVAILQPRWVLIWYLQKVLRRIKEIHETP